MKSNLHAVIYIAVSLDGFIARENGDLDWLTGPEAGNGGEDYGFWKLFNSIDVMVMGRRTFEKVLSFGKWPYGNKRVIVLTSSNLSIPTNLAGRVEKMNCTPAKLVELLAQERVGRIYVDGGKTIHGFLKAGLINELIIS